MPDSLTLCDRYLENTGSLSYVDLTNVATFYFTVSKNNILSPHSSERWLSIGKLSSSWWQIQFCQNYNFLLEAQILSLATNTVSCFP